MTDHVGESAALYALGLLDESERHAIDTHVAACAACGQLLAQAYDDVATIAMAEPQHTPPSRGLAATAPRRLPQSWLAIAAVLLLALLPSAYLVNQNLSMHRAMVADADAVARISSSPHTNVAFKGADANVMYGPDGSWYCVIVRGVSRPLHVVWPHDGEQTSLGMAMPHGDVAVLYLPKSHRMDRLTLMDEGRAVANADLTFE